MRLCHSAHDIRVFGALSGTRKEPAIVVEIPSELLPKDLAAISGTRLALTAAELPGLPPGRGAVVVQLRDPQFEDLFEQLGMCLLEDVCAKDSPADAVRAVVRQIERWRRFLERRREILTGEEVRGLIGELAVLERLIARIGADEALMSWKSPSGSIRDFECPALALEVKTFMASAGASVRISEPLQLQPEPGIPLLLTCVELARTQQPGCTLADHVSRISRRLEHDVTLIEEFENRLALAGYLPAHAERYCDGYVIGGVHAFLIDENFPRIRPADIPAHVIHVQFSLEVLPLTRFSVDPDVWIGSQVQETEDT